MTRRPEQEPGRDCGCREATDAGRRRATAPDGDAADSTLENLVPIAVVIAAGCEPCAERMVQRALSQGSDRAQIEKTLHIVAHLQGQYCFLEALGPEAIENMERPLDAAMKSLESPSATGA